MMMQVFVNGLRDPTSRERVILYSPKTLTEAAKYARFSETAVRVAHRTPQTASTSVNAMNPTNTYRHPPKPQAGNHQSRGSERGTARNRYNSFQSHNAPQDKRTKPFQKFNNRAGTVNNSQSNRCCFNCGRQGHLAKDCRCPKQQQPRQVQCFNCKKFGHKANVCRSPKQQSYQPGPRRNPNYTANVNAVEQQATGEYSGDRAEAWGQTSNCISTVPLSNDAKSPFHKSRKLCAVPGVINKAQVPSILVDCGSPVTIIRADLWRSLRDPLCPVENEPEDFQGVTRDGLRIIGVTQLEMRVGGLCVKHPVLIADEIAHKFILGNDFLTKHKCDILNSQGVIQFGNERVPYTLFRSTVNSICPVLCTIATTIGPNEEAVVPAFLDASDNYAQGETVLLEPRNDSSDSPLLGARVVVNYCSPVVPLLFANLSARSVTIPKNKIIADDSRALPIVSQPSTQLLPRSNDSRNVVGALKDSNISKEPTPVQQAMANADPALTLEQRSALEKLLTKYSHAFSSGPEDMGRTSVIYHKIDIGDSQPVRQGLRRIPHEHISVLKSEVDKLHKMGAIEPSISPFASPTILVKKKDGTMRLCIDYRKLNSITKKDAHPLPRIEDIFDTLSGSRYFTTLDLAMGYHQVEMNPDDREKTAFSTPFGLFQYNVMPFGLATAPATFMRLMSIVFSGMLYNTCLVYLDDIIIFGQTFVEHSQRLESVLKRLQDANLKLKPSKCAFGKKSVNFLGHIISDKGISTDPEKLKRIQEWPRPRKPDDIRIFLGYATYYRKFIKGFAKIVDPMNKLLHKDSIFQWTPACEDAFMRLKKAFLRSNHISVSKFFKTIYSGYRRKRLRYRSSTFAKEPIRY